MAGKSFTVRISLAGGVDIKKQLQDIGSSGKKAFEDLERAASANSTLDKLGVSLKSVQEKAQQVRAEIDKGREVFSNLKSTLSDVAVKVTAVAAAFSAVGVGVAAFVKGSAQNQKNIQDAADAAGLSAKEYENLKNAAAQAGVSGDDFAKSITGVSRALDESVKRNEQYNNSVRDLKRQLASGQINFQQFSTSMQKLNQNASDSQDAFTRLGVSTRNFDGSLKNPKQAFEGLADAFRELPDGATKAALSMELFGTKSSSLVSFMNQGSRGIAAFTLEAQRIAPPLDQLGRKNLLAVSTAFARLGAAATSAKDSIAATLAPLVSQSLNGLTEFIAKNRTALVLFVADITAKVKPVIDDLVAVLEGRDADVKSDMLRGARESVVAFGTAVSNAVTNIIIPALSALMSVFNTVATGINTIFGTNLTGTEIAAALVIAKLVGSFTLLASSISTVVTVFGGLISIFGAATIGAAALGVAIGAFIVSSAIRMGSLSEAASAVGQAISDAFSGALDFVSSLFSGLVDAANGAWQAVRDGVSAAADWVVDQFNSAVATVKGYFSGLIDLIASVVAKAQSAASAIASVVGGGDGAPGFASGGYVRGAGTGTSDSIPARLSNGEFVQPFKAVSYYGVGIMRALQSMRIPRDLLASFAGVGGGIASALTPPMTGFRNGGLVSVPAVGSGASGHPVQIHLPGNKIIEGLTATPDAVIELQKFATRSQIISTGRAPSWKGA
ncbi:MULTISPECIES: hypothetical protein [unclassified Nitrobacter]|uniref:hypothetical protein n=1 Tax=unclassified Nitrobacter TaxID=2620411 RepID=UPI001AD57823|nr:MULTISPECIES: hypothetical protein [unclassified Nitrobacter]MBN9149162.1 hypothetical protein [Nitrobacter sp.]